MVMKLKVTSFCCVMANMTYDLTLGCHQLCSTPLWSRFRRALGFAQSVNPMMLAQPVVQGILIMSQQPLSPLLPRVLALSLAGLSLQLTLQLTLTLTLTLSLSLNLTLNLTWNLTWNLTLAPTLIESQIELWAQYVPLLPYSRPSQYCVHAYACMCVWARML